MKGRWRIRGVQLFIEQQSNWSSDCSKTTTYFKVSCHKPLPRIHPCPNKKKLPCLGWKAILNLYSLKIKVYGSCGSHLVDRWSPGCRHYQQVEKKSWINMWATQPSVAKSELYPSNIPNIILLCGLGLQKWWAQVISLTSFSYWYSLRPNNELYGLLECVSRAFLMYLCIFTGNTETMRGSVSLLIKEKSDKYLKFRANSPVAALNYQLPSFLKVLPSKSNSI